MSTAIVTFGAISVTIVGIVLFALGMPVAAACVVGAGLVVVLAIAESR